MAKANRIYKYVVTPLFGLLAFALAAVFLTVRAHAGMVQYSRENAYAEYIGRHAGGNRPASPITLLASGYDASESAGVMPLSHHNGREDLLMFNSGAGSAAWTFYAEEAGLYHIKLSYCSVPSPHNQIELSFALDGAPPFSGAGRIIMPRAWKNETGDIPRDKRDNDIRPKQVEEFVWLSEYINSSEGMINEPYSVYLEEGRHTFAISASRAYFVLDSITFVNEPAAGTYADYIAEHDSKGAAETSGRLAVYQAETPSLKSDSTLYPTYDRTSAATQPSHPSKMRYNTVGGTITSTARYRS